MPLNREFAYIFISVKCVMQRRLTWLRRQYDDLLETLAQLHDQDIQQVANLSVPSAVVSAAQAAAVAVTARAQPRPPVDEGGLSEQRTVPNVPIARPPRPLPQPAASVAVSHSRPKLARKAGWVAQSLQNSNAQGSLQKRQRMQPPVGHDSQVGRSGSTSVAAAAQSLQQGSCCEWEDFDEHETIPETSTGVPGVSSCIDTAQVRREAASTQPNEILASRRSSHPVTNTVGVPVHKSDPQRNEEVVDSFQ